MSPPPLSPQARQYLEQVLAFNPGQHSAELLALRRSFLRLPRLADRLAFRASTEVGPVESRLKREKALAQLRKIQADFWQLSHEALISQLDGMQRFQTPEFRAVTTRLRIVASCRQEFGQLLARKDTDRHLVSAFRSAVTLSPDQATGARERFLYSLDSPERLKRVKATVRLIQTKYPLLYDLEKDWFRTITSYKLKQDPQFVSVLSGLGSLVDLGGYGRILGMMILFFLWMLITILMQVSRYR
jgi:hypothetical protein